MSAISKPPPTFPILEAKSFAPSPRAETEDLVLPEDYRPTKYDVINGRGKKSYNHIANRRFRQLTAMNLKRYQNAKCKVDKTVVVIGIVNSIRKSSPSGGFIKKCPNTGRWISMSDEGAREKVGHCLRDMIGNKREEARSSSKASSNAGEKIRNLAMQNQKSIFPTKLNNSGRGAVGSADPSTSMPMAAVHPNFLQQAKAQAKKTAAKRSPKTPPKRSKVLVSSGSNQAARTAHSGNRPPPGADSVDMPPITSTFNNFDYTTVTKGSSQEMSLQQRKILQLLEGGFKGSVEDVLRAVQ